MSNSFYNHGAFPSTGSAATSASMRAELDLVAAGFDKMPTLAGNANKFIVVNSTGTGLTQTDVLPAFTVTDTDFTVQDDGDNTRKFKFNAGSITTGNTRVYVMPDLDTTLVGTNVTQTLTNKTLTAPVIATIVNTGTLTLPTSTDTLIGRDTTDTLTNKTLTNPVIGTIVNTGTLTLPTSTDTLVGRQTTDTLTNKTISGASNTLSNIANGSLSNSSVVIGSSTLSLGGTLTTLAGVTISGASNTLSNIANASLTNSSITINGSTVALGSSVTVTATATNALTIGNGLSGTSYNGSAAVTIAINTGVTADLSTAQTFSNKTISGSANTLSNIANASLTNSAITIGSTAISLGATSLTIAGLTSASATTLISTGNQATSVAISAIGHSSGTVTVTTGTAHGLTTGDVASIDGVADYTFCGVYTVTVTNANVFTYSQTASGASSSGGFSTKLTGTWGLYAGGTGPSLANGPVMVSASSQMPALRVTQGGSGYALIVEDATNPDTSAFIISNAGDLAINTNKFTVAAASGNTVIGGTTSFGGNIVSNVLFTDATYDIGATGANRPRDLFLSRNLTVGGTLTLAGGVNLNGNVTIGDASTDTLTINSTITSNLIFTDNTYDIGASGATRPRNLYLAGLLTMGGALSVTGATTLTGALNANGNVTLGNAAADNITVTGTITSNLIFTDNTYDIGASGATRPRNLYLGGLLTMGGALTVNGSTTLGDASGDTLTINGTAVSIPNNLNFDSNLLFIDAANNRVAVGTNLPEDYFELSYSDGTTSGTSGMLITNANSTTSTIASLLFRNYDNFGAAIKSLRTGSPAGLLTFGTNNGVGTAIANITEKMRITSDGIVVNNGALDYDFRIASDNNSYAFFVDAGNDQVVVGSSTPYTGSASNIPFVVRYSSGPSVRFYSNVSADRIATAGISVTTYGDSRYAGYQTTGGGGMWVNSSSGATTLLTAPSTSGVLRLGNFNQDPFENTSVAFVEYANFNSGEIVFNDESRDIDFRVESDGMSYAFFVDAGNNAVGINNSNPTVNNPASVRLTMGDSGSSSRIQQNVNGGGAIYGGVDTVNNPSNGFRVGHVNGTDRLEIAVGTNDSVLDARATSLTINQLSADQDFIVESDSYSTMVYVDAGLNRVGFGTSSPVAVIDIPYLSQTNFPIARFERDRASRIHVFATGGSTKTVTVDISDYGLTGFVAFVDVSGHNSSNGADRWYDRFAWALMEESGSSRVNNRLTNYEFAYGTSRTGSPTASFTGGGATRITFTVTAGYDTKVWVKIESAGAGQVSSISVA